MKPQPPPSSLIAGSRVASAREPQTRWLQRRRRTSGISTWATR